MTPISKPSINLDLKTELNDRLTVISPGLIQKVDYKTGRKQWDWKIHQTVMICCSYRTSPSCIAQTTLTVAEIASPNIDIAAELPTVRLGSTKYVLFIFLVWSST